MSDDINLHQKVGMFGKPDLEPAEAAKYLEDAISGALKLRS
jgi:hypothetical protein